ncbi:microcephalin isoform X2 [Amblyraja radiata]|uniref:microcephalin isoform X2 n=1 Tax=Amblyraja radiata TaxID=386614 RepID=UPI001404262A|nr:microcephalin isoform X2 [Amblyraja radiata]
MWGERSEPQRLGQNIFAQDHDCRMTSDCSKTSILQDVVAFVNVWSSNRTENYSKSFEEDLVDMGARVLKFFNKHVTHVVFKDGHESVWKKAQKTGVKLVSVLWVERCLTTHTHVDESLFPAINESKHSPKSKRTHRCMKPKDFIEKTPTNNKRLKKKLDQMIRELDLKRTVGADLNLLSLEEEAVGLYSSNVELVPFNHFCGMEKRLKEMKEKRENPSPTASQMSQLTSASALSPCQPDLGESPSSFAKALFADEYEIDSGGASSGGASINKTLSKYAHESKDPLSAEAHEGQTGHHSSQEFFTRGMHLVKSSQVENGKTLPRRNKMKSPFPKRQSAKAVLHCVEESVGSWSKKAIQSYSEGSVEALNSAAADLRLCNAQSNKIVQLPLPVKSAASEKDHNLTQTDFSSNECYKNYVSPLISNISTRTKNQLSLKKNKKLWQDDFMCFKSPRNNPLEACDCSDKNDACPIKEDLLAYEDFFSPVNLNCKNNPRCTLGMLPPKSPSLPDIFGSGKQKRKLQEMNPQTSADRTKKTRSATNVSVEEQSDARFYGQHVNAAALTGENVALQPDAAKAQKKRKSHVKNPFQYFFDESGALTNDVPERKEPGQHHEMKRLDLLLKHNSDLKPPTLRHETQAFSVISLRPCDETKANEKDVQCLQEDNLAKDILKLQSIDSDLDGNPHSGPNQSSPSRLRMNCFHEEKNKLIEGANTTKNCIRKNVKPTRTLVMTSMPSENQSIIIQIVKRFGGFQFSDNVCETTTHVVAGHTRRTLNVLFGIARGCWILSFNWILWSLEQGCWAPEESFELSTQFPAATICRFERQSTKEPYLQDLFVNQPLIFISPQSKPPAPALEKLVLLCGGQVCKTLRRTGICIGQYKGRRPAGNQHLSENWILDSITKHEVCSPDNYTLE